LRKKKKEKSHGKADALPWLFDEVLREKGLFEAIPFLWNVDLAAGLFLI